MIVQFTCYDCGAKSSYSLEELTHFVWNPGNRPLAPSDVLGGVLILPCKPCGAENEIRTPRPRPTPEVTWVNDGGRDRRRYPKWLSRFLAWLWQQATT